jgi:hypothetical protein
MGLSSVAIMCSVAAPECCVHRETSDCRRINERGARAGGIDQDLLARADGAPDEKLE